MLNNAVVKKDNFLSSILNKSCYAIKGSIKKNFTFKNNSFYYLKMEASNKGQQRVFLKKKFELIEKNLIFFGKYKKKKSRNLEIVNVKRNQRKMKFSSDLFKFENSRFFNDRRIPKKTSINLKQKWLNNFFKRKRGDKLYVLKKNNEIVGYILMFIVKNLAIIDLINIKTNYRKKGFAKEIINEFFLNHSKIKYLQAGTQSKNKSAISFYKSIGLKLIKKLNVYHLHT